MTVEGLERVTMRRLAEALDTGAASLYVYFRDVADLHGAILDRLLADAEPMPRARDWQSGVERTLFAYLGILIEYPSLARAIFVRRPSGEHYVGLIERLLAEMSRGGVPPDRAAWGVDFLLQLVTATAAEHTTRDSAGEEAAAEVARQIAAVEDASPKRFPHVHAVTDELFSGSGRDRLAWAIRSLLAGIAATPRPPDSRGGRIRDNDG
jgi:AcrR family transcriptional regulator